MSARGIVPIILVMLATLAGAVVFIDMFGARVTDSDEPIQIHIDPSSFPTPAPTHTPMPTHTPVPTILPHQTWRGVTTFLQERDTHTGLVSTSEQPQTANANPWDGTEDYGWVTELDFHPSDRIPETHNSLLVPGCITADGQHDQRYLYTQSLDHGPPEGFTLDGFPTTMQYQGQTIWAEGRPTPIPTASPPSPRPSEYVDPTPIPTPTPDHGLWGMPLLQDCSAIGGGRLEVHD